MLKNLYDLDVIQSDNYRRIDPSIVANLVVSITNIGLQEPIRLFHIEESGELFVVSGHHRLAAMRKIKRCPEHKNRVFQAYVTRGSKAEYLSQETAVKSVMGNLLRPGISLLDRSSAYRKLIQVGLTAADIARMLNVGEGQVNQVLAVAALPEAARELIHKYPVIGETAIIELALRLEEDHAFPVMAALKDLLRRSKEEGDAFVSRSRFYERLVATGKFDADQIKSVMGCFDGSEQARPEPYRIPS